ncbi:MAG: transporter, partial [Polyangiales bacterium]
GWRDTMGRALLALAGAVISAIGGTAAVQAQLNASAPIVTDRPGNGNAALTVPQLSLQLETSISYAHDRTAGIDTHLLNLPTALRFGALSWLELRLLSGLVGMAKVEDVDAEWEATDLAVGTKLSLLRQDGAQPDLAFSGDIFLPTGTGLFDGGAVMPELRLLAAWGLPKGFGLLFNLGTDIPDDAEGRFARLLYVANLGYVIPGTGSRLSAFVEGYGRIAFADGRPDIVQIDLGAAFLLSPTLQFDLFTQHGLKDGTPDFQVAVGFSGRFFGRSAAQAQRSAPGIQSAARSSGGRTQAL